MVNGNLPDGWTIQELENCVDILDNQRKPINATEREKRIAGKDEKKLFPYYGATGKVGLIDDYLLDEEVVLLGEDGAPFLDFGKDKAYMVRGKSWVNNHAHVLRAKAGIISNLFLVHYLNYFDYHGYVTGTTRLKLNQGQMKKFPVKFPPLPEQERIVAKIEELFTQLEAGTAALERVQAGLKRYKASVLKAACEGKLLENREIEISGELPEGWKWVQISAFLDNKRGAMKTGPFGSLLKKHEHRESGVPVIGIENIKNMEFVLGSKIHITEEKADQLAGYDLQPGDIVISRSGTVGEVAVIPDYLGNARMSTNIMRVCLDKSVMLPKFFTFLFNGSPIVLEQVADLCKGSTRNFLNQHILKSINFPLPPLEEQRQIVAEVERRLSLAVGVESTLAASLSRAGRLRQSVLKSAFEGRLV